MEQLALIVPGMWADHHVIAVRGLFREVEGVEVTGASAMDATLRLEYDPAKTDPQRIAARLEEAGYAVGEAPDADAPPTDKPAWADGRGARHRYRSGRPHHVGRPPQVLIAPSCVHPPVHDPPGHPGRAHGAARPRLGREGVASWMTRRNDDVKPVAAKSIDPAALEMLAHAEGCGIEHRVLPRGHHEALSHRRVRRLLPHLLHGPLPPRRQGRRGEDRHLRRRHGHDRLPPLRPPGGRRRGRPLGPRPRHGDDAARRRHRRGRGLQGQGRAEAAHRGRVPGHPHQRPRGQRDRPRRRRRRAGAVRPVARRDRLHQARDAQAAGQVARAGPHPSRHRPRGRRGHAPHARGRRPRRREHPQVARCAAPWPTAGAARC